MGQCLSCCKRPKDNVINVLKQNKNIDDKRMFKLGIDVLNRDFCIQIGYNRKAVKTYGQRQPEAREGHRNAAPEEGGVSQTPPSERVEDPTACAVVS